MNKEILTNKQFEHCTDLVGSFIKLSKEKMIELYGLDKKIGNKHAQDILIKVIEDGEFVVRELDTALNKELKHEYDFKLNKYLEMVTTILIGVKSLLHEQLTWEIYNVSCCMEEQLIDEDDIENKKED